MSRAATATDLRVERAVVKRSQYADTLHRPDPDSDTPKPACDQATVSYDGDYREIAPGTHPTYNLCQNPACFGDDHRRGGHIWPGLLTNRPLRIQAFHVAVVAAIEGETPVSRAEIEGILAVESNQRSVRRGIRDAVDGGWLQWREDPPAYHRGPLAVAIAADPHPHAGGESA